MATIVLVHGGWAGGWVWADVARRLRAAGHEVYTPTLTGLGERVHLVTRDVGLDLHVTDVADVLGYEALRDVVLVGHSYGGMVITGVAERTPERLAHLIYLDAYVPRDGESLLDLLQPEARRSLEDLFRGSDDGWRCPPLPGSTARHAPHPWKCFAQPLTVTDPTAAALPRSYIRHTADKEPGAFMGQCFATSFARATAGGWPLRDLDIAHGFRATPEPVAVALREAVGAATAPS